MPSWFASAFAKTRSMSGLPAASALLRLPSPFVSRSVQPLPPVFACADSLTEAFVPVEGAVSPAVADVDAVVAGGLADGIGVFAVGVVAAVGSSGVVGAGAIVAAAAGGAVTDCVVGWVA